MIPAFLTCFSLGLSLIVASGTQTSFVLMQAILSQHVIYVTFSCPLADALLISIGVAGISFFLNNIINQISSTLFGFSALWLTGYGVLRLKAVFKADIMVEIESSKSKRLIPTLSIAAILTFANPHVYLDTMVLIGSISQQFSGYYRIAFALGACLSSFVFFFSLAYGARLLEPIMKSPSSWRILDGLIALIMFIIAFKLASAGNWL